MISNSVPSTSSPTKDVKDTTYEEESERSSKNLEVSDGDRDEEDEDEEVSWVTWFCNQKGNEFFCQVDDGYLLDDSNLSGLSSQVPCYDYALDLILDVESSHDEFTDEQNDLVEWTAEMLYGLIHARYILTSQGMATMLEKYRSYDFGTCPRFHCNKQRCLPVGKSDTPRSRTVKIYCPKCEDIYAPESKHQESILIFVVTFTHQLLLAFNRRELIKNMRCSSAELQLLKTHGWTPHTTLFQRSCASAEPFIDCFRTTLSFNSVLDIDGAYFGTTFPHLFFMNNPDLRPEKANENYVPRIYGFKISK